MNQELLYQLSLALVPNVGDVHARILMQHFGSASAIFKAPLFTLEKLEGIGSVRARSIKLFRNFEQAESEIAFLEKFNIRKIFIDDDDYPKRLFHCYDAPVLLFHKGMANLNTSKIIGIVGTRNASEYGRTVTEKLIQDLAGLDILIISGLAVGIDAIAHKASIKNNLPTVGVIGHGLDNLYPYENTSLAKEMVKNSGGLLTEFFSGTKPDKHNFPLRNRIVAGLCDALIVIETNVKGGSMITAKLADSYHRDIFAVPGKVTDNKSSGCNYLIRKNKAMMITCADDLIEMMGWQENKIKPKKQRELFHEFSEAEKNIIKFLEENGMKSIDELNGNCNLTSSETAAAILNLELNGIIESLPGKIYRLMH